MARSLLQACRSTFQSSQATAGNVFEEEGTYAGSDTVSGHIVQAQECVSSVRSPKVTTNLEVMPCMTFNHGSGSSQCSKGVNEFLLAYAKTLPYKPSGVVVIEAHVEANPVEVVGDQELATSVADLLGSSDIPVRMCCSDRARGHGDADVMRAFCRPRLPFVTISLRAGQNAAEHLAMGMALSPLRHEGVLLIGSGVPLFHNFDVLFSQSQTKVAEGIKQSFMFDGWLLQTLEETDASKRLARLLDWESAPGARVCHPLGAAEHFMPTLVIAGAAENAPGLPTCEFSHAKIIGRTPRFATHHFDFRP
jgi:aromatic ring-opening dioxygenase catalytic subunit (LigB family)